VEYLVFSQTPFYHKISEKKDDWTGRVR